MTGRAAATRYARALFDVAVREGADVDAIGTDVAAFAELMTANPALGRAFANPAIPAGRKRAVVEQLLSASPVSPMVTRLLLMLAERDRLMLVSAIADAYRARLLEHAQVVRAEVTTAMPVPADRLAALQQGLARATGRDVRLDTRVDPAIIGGAVARIGSIVYDGSLATQLAKLKEQLVQAGG